jgi:hypothetical protein
MTVLVDFLNKIVFRSCVQYHKAQFWMQNVLNRSTLWIKTSRSRLSTCLNFLCFFSESKCYLQIPHSKHLSFQYKQFLGWKHSCLSFIGWLSKISFLPKNLGVFKWQSRKNGKKLLNEARYPANKYYFSRWQELNFG